MNFRRWRQQTRLVDALGHLARGASIAQVAAHAGYTNPSAFAVMFKRQLGCEPSRYFGVTPAPDSGDPMADSQRLPLINP